MHKHVFEVVMVVMMVVSSTVAYVSLKVAQLAKAHLACSMRPRHVEHGNLCTQTCLGCGKLLLPRCTYLWLRTALIGSNQQQRSVHDCCSVEHGSHQNIVTRAVNK